MISEKVFTLSHSAFWRELLPMAESYVRECNVESARFAPHLDSALPPADRGLVNEVGFRLFAAGVRLREPADGLERAVIDDCMVAGLRHISAMRQLQRHPPQPLKPAGLDEAVAIARRLEDFFAAPGLGVPTLFPELPGCGWVDRCYADALAGSTLFEIKAGDRGFRSADVRQLLCYCALNFAAKRYQISHVCLVNPRTGRYVGESLDAMSKHLAGRSATELLAQIVHYVSDAPDRYTAS
ncbi:MAG: hypothetical protein IT375_25400 [Polyangiaceae bacterium]|nr:hypothetical protein [Polyangiaceae bacterium]